MARPKKQSLDYFPLDVDALEDAKLRAPRQEFGYMATLVYVQLLCMVYRDKGYYLPYNDRTRDNVLWTLTTGTLAGKYQPQTTTVAQVIDRLVACELFSGDLYQTGILTSKRIQETYYSATAARKDIHIQWEYWLLDQETMERLSSRSVILSNFVNRFKNHGYSLEKPPLLERESTQRKGKEKKEKESKGEESKKEESKLNESKENRKESNESSFLYSYRARFQEHFGNQPSRGHLTSIQNLLEGGRTEQELLDALEYAAARKPSDPEPYVYVTVRDWKPQQITTPDTNAKHHPTGELTDWEREWLEEIEQRRRQEMESEA